MIWPSVKLASESHVITKGTTPTSVGFDFVESGIPFVRVQNLMHGTVSIDNDPLFVDEATHYALKRSKVFPGDLLISIAGTIGRTAIVPDDAKEMNCNQAVAIIRPKSCLDKKYLRYWLESDDAVRQISKGKVTATISNLSLGQIGALKIPLPPIEEQKRIAAILDQADSLRRLRQRAIDRLNTLGQAIFYEMFGDWRFGLSPYGKTNLGSKIDFLTSGSRGWAKYYSDSGAKFIRIQNVAQDVFDETDMALVDAPNSAEARRTRVQAGDVLVSITADLGRTAVVPHGIGDAYINQHLALLRGEHFNSRFLSSALASPSGKAEMAKRNRAGVKAGLNFDDIRSIEIIDPPREIQDDFEHRLQAVEQLSSWMQEGMVVHTRMFSSLQHRAFRGEL